MIPIIYLFIVSAGFLILGRKLLPSRKLLALSVFHLFLLLAFRENFGNDYGAYREMFNEFSQMSDPFDYSSDRHMESGWIFLNVLFSNLGFKAMVASLTMFAFYSIVVFVSRYSPPKYYWLSIAIFVFTPTNLLIQLSAQRQALAIMLFLISIQFISDRKILTYFSIVFTAYFIHASAIALLPLYFLSRFEFNIPKYLIPVALLLYVTLFKISSIDSVSQLMQILSVWGDKFNFDKYTVYEADGEGTLGSGFGAFFYGIIMAMLLYYIPKQTKEVKPLFMISILGIFMIPLIGALGAFERFSAYLSVTLIVTTPILASEIKNSLIRNTFVMISFLYPFYGFINFFQNPTYKNYYQNIL